MIWPCRLIETSLLTTLSPCRSTKCTDMRQLFCWLINTPETVRKMRCGVSLLGSGAITHAHTHRGGGHPAPPWRGRKAHGSLHSDQRSLQPFHHGQGSIKKWQAGAGNLGEDTHLSPKPPSQPTGQQSTCWGPGNLWAHNLRLPLLPNRPKGRRQEGDRREGKKKKE